MGVHDLQLQKSWKEENGNAFVRLPQGGLTLISKGFYIGTDGRSHLPKNGWRRTRATLASILRQP